MDSIKKIANFLFELNSAKCLARSGWRNIGVKNPESVAEHTASCAQIAFILAKMENADAERSAVLALFHDIGEVRCGDSNLVAKIYRDKNGAEEKAFRAQTQELPMGSDLREFFDELKDMKTREAAIVKDADLLESAVQAKVYSESGYQSAPIFIDGMRDKLKTKSAKKILAEIEKSEIKDWWLAIPEIAQIAEKILKREK